jgi:sulfide:quinone oxidoreductase
MTEQRITRPHRVVIAGGGVAALEALLALRDLAGDRVAVTLVAPTDEFVVRAMSVTEPFGGPGLVPYDIERACADHGATFRRDAIHAVQPGRKAVLTRSGAMLDYDSLLLAVGARPIPSLPGTITFRGPADTAVMRDLLGAVDRGEVEHIAFVAPTTATWTLPLYELALMTAEHAADHGVHVGLTVVTPETAPVSALGSAASAQVAELLDERGVAVRAGAHVRRVSGDTILAAPGDMWVHADRIVAVPALRGPGMPGLPADREGFLTVDEHGMVPGLDGVFGAGDGTSNPVKQGGVAAQQAGIAARATARRAGADVEVEAFRPQLQARLVAGRTTLALGLDEGKVAAPYLAPYLRRLREDAVVG